MVEPTSSRSETVVLPGGRDVRGTLDRPGDADGRIGHPDDGDPDGTVAAVVACPPHPQYGGTRNDSRLVAVADALTGRGIDCLRFDYGPWDEGRGERADVRAALRWATDRSDRVGLFGYSFGATVALLAAAEATTAAARETPAATSVLAPATTVGSNHDSDAVAALGAIDTPIQVVYGERDTTVDWEPVVERARERNASVTALPADHFVLGRTADAAETIAAFFDTHL